MSLYRQPQIIFHDADGCLNDPSGEEFSSGDLGTLSPKQRRSLEDFGRFIDERGMTLVINTGRNFWDLRHIAEGMSCRQLRFALLEHSAYAWDFVENVEVDLQVLAKELGEEELYARYEQMKIIEGLIQWYQSEGHKWLSEQIGVEAPKALTKRSNLSLPLPEGWKPQDLMVVLREVVEEHFPLGKSPTLQYCHSNFFVDILGPIHKSDGAKLLLKHLGFEAADALVVGDGMNDLDMFSADWPNLLCPSNAYRELKDACHRHGGVVSEHAFVKASWHHLNGASKN